MPHTRQMLLWMLAPGLMLFILTACGGLTPDGATPTLPRQTPVSVLATPRQQTQTLSTGAGEEDSKVILPVYDPLDAEGEIVITGSATVFPLIAQTADRFIRQGFRGTIQLSRSGTVSGIAAWCSDSKDSPQIDIIMASRPLTSDEMRRCFETGHVPMSVVVARDELTVFVNNQNQFVQNLTLAELNHVFTADNWSDVKPQWPHEAIQRYIPDATSGTLEWFVEQVFAGDPTALNIAANTARSGNPTALVYSVNSDANGIGFAGRALVIRNPDQVRAIPIISSDQDTLDGDDQVSNPLARDLYIYTDLYAVRAKPELAAFITFILNNVYRDTFDVGYLPTSSEVLDQSKGRFLEGLRGDMRVSGSTTVAPLAQAGLAQFQANGYDGFVQIDAIGSGAGLKEFCETLLNDMAISSRPMNDKERATCATNGRPPIELRLATDAFVFAVNRQNTFVQSLTYEDVIAIYKAERWSDVNPAWPDAEIVHFMFGPDTGGMGVLADEIYDGDVEAPLSGPNVTPIDSGLEMTDVVSRDPNAIGIMALPFYLKYSDIIRALPMDGIEANAETIENGQYPLGRFLFAYVDAATLQSHPQVTAYLYTLLNTLTQTTAETGYIAPSERILNQNISQLALALVSKP